MRSWAFFASKSTPRKKNITVSEFYVASYRTTLMLLIESFSCHQKHEFWCRVNMNILHKGAGGRGDEDHRLPLRCGS